MDWEFGISRCKLLYIEWIHNKVLLYSAGNYIQYPIINHNGKEFFFKKKDPQPEHRTLHGYPSPAWLLKSFVIQPSLLLHLQPSSLSASHHSKLLLVSFSFFNLFILFIYFFLAALRLRCCARAFSSCSERGLLFNVVRWLLIAVAPLVVEHRLWHAGFSSCGSWAQ